MYKAILKEILWYAISLVLVALGRAASSRAYRTATV